MMLGFDNLPAIIKKYIPDFEYMLSDLGASDKDKKLNEEHSIVIRTLNKARYANKDELREIASQISEEGGDLVMTLADRLEERGLKKGIEKGKAEGIRKSIQITLFNRFGISNLKVRKLIDQISDSEMLEGLLNKAFQVSTPEEFIDFVDNIKM